MYRTEKSAAVAAAAILILLKARSARRALDSVKMVLGELCGPAESGLEMGQPRANDVSGIGPDWMVTCGAPDVVRQVEDGADRLLMAQFRGMRRRGMGSPLCPM